MADLGDVSSIGYWERQAHYLDSLGGTDLAIRAAMHDTSHHYAAGEMLDEIHTMLRHLCKVSCHGQDTAPPKPAGP